MEGRAREILLINFDFLTIYLLLANAAVNYMREVMASKDQIRSNVKAY